MISVRHILSEAWASPFKNSLDLVQTRSSMAPILEVLAQDLRFQSVLALQRGVQGVEGVRKMLWLVSKRSIATDRSQPILLKNSSRETKSTF